MAMVGIWKLHILQQQRHKEAGVVDAGLGQLLAEGAVHAVTAHREVRLAGAQLA
jgi:hypothetical protein